MTNKYISATTASLPYGGYLKPTRIHPPLIARDIQCGDFSSLISALPYLNLNQFEQVTSIYPLKFAVLYSNPSVINDLFTYGTPLHESKIYSTLEHLLSQPYHPLSEKTLKLLLSYGVPSLLPNRPSLFLLSLRNPQLSYTSVLLNYPLPNWSQDVQDAFDSIPDEIKPAFSLLLAPFFPSILI